MPTQSRKDLIKLFETLPGIGRSIAEDLVDLGFVSFADLKKQKPEKIYEQLNILRRATVDPCVLYVFRCVYYYLNTPIEKQKPHLLKWWNWKD
jgi:predicted aspartyl protease